MAAEEVGLEAAQPPAEQAPKAAGKQMPPEARAAAQKLIAVAMRVVYKSEVSKKLIDMVRKAPRPEVGIAQAVFMVLKLVKDSAKGVPPNVIDSMARPIAMMVMELAGKAGLIEAKPEILQTVLALIQRALQMAQQGGQPGGPQPPAQPQPPAAAPQPAAGPPPGGILNEQMGAMP